MLVFRDTRRSLPAHLAQRELRERCQRAGAGARELLASLIAAGEVEAAVADLGSPAVSTAQALTDLCASAVLGPGRLDLERCSACIDALGGPHELHLVRPEGYAYYALDPRSYARAIRACRIERGRRSIVIGVRSIGTSLSAMVSGALTARGADAARFTVRPHGAAWDRRCEFSEAERSLLLGRRDTEYWVVDEGPGLSGSTFLSVAEALERLGIERARIVLLTSHGVDPERLVATDGARRWRRFNACAVEPLALPEGATDLGGGAWRRRVYASEAEWPPSWTQLERCKYLSEPSSLIKFVGFGVYGEAPLQRARELAQASFIPDVEADEPGFCRQRWLRGRPLDELSDRAAIFERLLEYLIFRRTLPAPERSATVATEALGLMLKQNLQEACGLDLELELSLEHPVIVDGRLQPHEWWLTTDGRILKLDALDHGDDHLFPGPCDCAWDIAGATVEWGMGEGEVQELLARYRAATGDRVAARLSAYQLAYTLFRLGCTQMAVLACAPSEEARLERQRQRYAAALARLVADLHGSARPLPMRE